jgi:hypothetical protein
MLFNKLSVRLGETVNWAGEERAAACYGPRCMQWLMAAWAPIL